MTEIRKSKQRLVMEVLVIEYWNLRPARSCPRPPRLARPPSASPQANAGRAWLASELAMAGGFICNLVLGVCYFRHNTPRQSYYLWPPILGTGKAHRRSRHAGKDQVFQD